MIEDFALSIIIGIVSAILVIALWIYTKYISFEYLCKKLLQRIILCLKNDENEGSLPKLCTQEFIDNIEPLKNVVTNIGPIISIDKFKFELFNTVNKKMRTIISFEIIHENGTMKGQAILYKYPKKTLMQQLVIFS